MRLSRRAVFLVNGSVTPEINEPDFARRFFGIWLSPATSAPTLRAQLLGQQP